MQRLIDANVLKPSICTNTNIGIYRECYDGSEVVFTSREIDNSIDNAPTIDAVPVRHGEWTYSNHAWTCTFCAWKQSSDFYTIPNSTLKYCPHCGAKMEECHTPTDE